jgi:predicted ATPase/DNA-binding SARP family transcriptional activator
VNPASVRVRLLGGLAVELDGVAVADSVWARRQGAALVALLALADNRRLHRERVIDALWPDLAVDDAAPRLHKAAHHARRALGSPDAITTRSEMVMLFPEATVAVDAIAFADAADHALAAGDIDAADVALALYGGELLPEFSYDEWVSEPRDRLRLLHVQLLRQAQRWEELVAADPTDEAAHVAVMRRLTDDGAPRSALLQFDHLAQVLARELGVEPGSAAIDARERAMAAAAAGDVVPSRGRPPASPREPARLGDFPHPGDEFLGREGELAAIASAFEASRIVTLFGPAGVGKTRLAVEYLRSHPADVVFIDLSRGLESESVAASILGALGASTRSDVPDVERVVETLETRTAVLVLDNCEHLTDAVAAVAERVARDTWGVQVLLTSREALGVAEEHVVPVPPLGLPASGASAAERRSADAVRLLTERTQRAGGIVDDLDAVVRLARRLDGIPLALEIAAARTRTFSPQQILAQLDEGWPLTAPRRATGPAHHVSLDETIDWSYRLLSDDERSLFLYLSTFRGPFDLAAVAAVAGVVPIRAADLLARLVDKSLVQSSVGRAGRRLRLLESVRRFASVRFDESLATVARARHAAHFAARTADLGAMVPGPNEDDALAHLSVEFDDITAAFEHAGTCHDIETMARLVDGPRLSLSTEGARWAHLALRAVDVPGLDGDERYLSILASAAWGAVLRGELSRAQELARRGLDLADDPARHPRLCWIWPQALGESFAVGVQSCLDGARLAHDRGDIAAQSFLLSTAALYRLVVNEERGAVELAEVALDLARSVGSRSLTARAGGTLSYALQDLDAAWARRAADEVLAVASSGDFHLNMPHRVLANLAWRDGEAIVAAEHAALAGEVIRAQGDRYVQAAAMRQLAVIVGDVDAPLAAELLGVADAIVPGIPVLARDVRAVTQLTARLEKDLGPEQFESIVQQGRRTDARAAFVTAQRGITRIRRGRDESEEPRTSPGS